MTQMQHCSRWLLLVPPTACLLSSLPVCPPAPQSHHFAVPGCLIFSCSSWSAAPTQLAKSCWSLRLACLLRLSLSSRNWDEQSAFWTGLPSKSRFWATFPHFYPVAGQIPSPHKPLVPAPSGKGSQHHCHHHSLCLLLKWVSEKEHACCMWWRGKRDLSWSIS